MRIGLEVGPPGTLSTSIMSRNSRQVAPARFRGVTRDRKRTMALDRLESFAVLRDVVAEVLAIDADQVLEDAKFREDLDADSLDLVEIVMLLEDRLGISLPGQGLREIATVGQALDLWMAHAQASS